MPHTLRKNEKFTYSHQRIFRQINQHLAIYLVKPLLSRNFCQKSATVNLRNFHIVGYNFRYFIDAFLISERTCSCPCCRFELPTDDKDYEEMRKQKKRMKQRKEDIENLHNSMFG